MILCDVNVLLAALFAQSPHHARCRKQVERLRQSGEAHGVSELILAAVVRIGSNPKVFRPTPAVDEVFAFTEGWRSHPQATRIEPGRRHWTIFRDLVRVTGIQGSAITDATFAALAIEHGCQWWTLDADYARFPGLHYRDLLDT